MMFSDPQKRCGQRELSPTLSEQEGQRDPSPTLSEQEEQPIKYEEPEIQIYHDKTSPSLSPAPDHMSLPPPQQEQDQEDNPALLDSLLTTLIFTEVKPTPLPRLISDLSHRLPMIPQDHVERVLNTTACIGIVHRSGKDAAGKELSNEYYYIPESTFHKGYY